MASPTNNVIVLAVGDDLKQGDVEGALVFHLRKEAPGLMEEVRAVLDGLPVDVLVCPERCAIPSMGRQLPVVRPGRGLVERAVNSAKPGDWCVTVDGSKGVVTLNLRTGVITGSSGKKKKLTPFPLRVLCLLSAGQGRWLSGRHIGQLVWNDPGTRQASNQLNTLRNHFEEFGIREAIPGDGRNPASYRLQSLRADQPSPLKAGATDTDVLAALAGVVSRLCVLPQFFRLGDDEAAFDAVTVQLSVEHGARNSALLDGELSGHTQDQARILSGAALGRPGAAFAFGRLLQQDHRHWMVLGSPGSGKTTALRKLAREQADLGQPVVLLKVADLVDEGLKEFCNRLSTGSWPAFQRAMLDGRAVVLVDGLDEVEDVGRAWQAIAALLREAEDARVIITSRPTGYEAGVKGLHHVRICPLDDAQREELLARWLRRAPDGAGRYSTHRDRARAELARLDERHRLNRLTRNPLVLAMVGRLLVEGKEPPRRRAELYVQVLRLILTRGYGGAPAFADDEAADEALEALCRVALHVVLHQGPVVSRQVLETALKRAPEHIAERFPTAADRRDFLRRVHDSGVLESTRTRATALHKSWVFAHRTFLEYLSAQALAADIAHRGVPGSLASGQLQEALHAAVADPRRLAEVFALLVGFGEHASELVDAINQADQGEGKPLLHQVLVDADDLDAETVWRVIGVERARENWQSRAEVFERLPDLVGRRPDLVVRLVRRYLRDVKPRHGADLYWMMELLRQVADGEVSREPMEGSQEEWQARAQAINVFAHIPEEQGQQAIEVLRELGQMIAPQADDPLLAVWRPIEAADTSLGSPDGWGDSESDLSCRRERLLCPVLWMLAVPVTRSLYGCFDPEDAYRHEFSGLSIPAEELSNHPIVNVSWWEAAAFAEWLGTLRDEWLGCRLPTEGEWDFAALVQWYDSPDLERFGWYRRNSLSRTQVVASKPPNIFGLHDMHGNVYEWCHEPEGPATGNKPAGAAAKSEGDGNVLRATPDGDGPVQFQRSSALSEAEATTKRLIVGGSWFESPPDSRVAPRRMEQPSFYLDDLGFRVVNVRWSARPFPKYEMEGYGWVRTEWKISPTLSL